VADHAQHRVGDEQEKDEPPELRTAGLAAEIEILPGHARLDGFLDLHGFSSVCRSLVRAVPDGRRTHLRGRSRARAVRPAITRQPELEVGESRASAGTRDLLIGKQELSCNNKQ
jgi:hypothetical protein